MRVCMFVYNNCANDPRVLKEARSLTRAGHAVQIVAVLDKTTVPDEERDGFTIARIARDPPHYKLLRLSRRVRRRLRLTRARVKRWARTKVRPLTRLRTALARRQHEAADPASARTEARARRAEERHAARAERHAEAERRRLAEADRRADEARSSAAEKARLATERARALAAEAEASPPVEAAASATGLARAYRAVRWRVLRRSALARRLYYGRRTAKKRKRIRRARQASAHADALVRRSTQADVRVQGATPAEPATSAPGHARALPVPVRIALAPPGFVALVARTLLRLLVGLARRLERAVSHGSYRTLMYFHRPMMHIDYYVRAYKFVRPQEFDAFHAHDLNTLPVAWALARATKRRLIYDAHELYPEISTLSRTECAIWKVVERRLIRRAVSVVTVCESIAGELATRYGVPKPTIVLNCPPAAFGEQAHDTTRLRVLLGMRDDPRAIVLYQGGFAPNRGLEELVLAGRYIDGGRIVLMGGGRIESDLRELIERERLAETVVITDSVPSADVIPYATGADLGVIPYKGVGLNNYYTTPNKLFDYMAAKIPIAGSRFPEIIRFVEDLGIGVTFDPESPRDIAYAVNYLLDDPSLLEEMRARATEASRQFVWEHEEEKLLAIYGALEPVAV